MDPRSLPGDLAMQRDHFYRCRGRFESLVAGLQASAVESLLQGIAGEDTEGVGDARFLLRLADAAGDLVVDGFVVGRLTAQEAADGDDGVYQFGLGDLAGGGGDLPCAGNAKDVDLVFPDAAAVEAIERAFEQAVGDDGVPAGDDDGELHAPGSEIAGERDGLAAERVEPLPEGKGDAGNGLNGEDAGLPVRFGCLGDVF